MATIPPLSAIEEIVLNNLDGKKHITRFYNLLAGCSKESILDRLTDIQEDISDEDWKTAI